MAFWFSMLPTGDTVERRKNRVEFFANEKGISFIARIDTTKPDNTMQLPKKVDAPDYL